MVFICDDEGMNALLAGGQDAQATELVNLEAHVVGLEANEPVNYSTALPYREGILQVQVAVDVEGCHFRT